MGLSSLEMSRSRSRSPWRRRRETPDAAPAGHVHEVAPGQRDLGAQPGALAAHRVLGDLHEHLLAVLERVADAAGALLALRRGDLVDVQEAVLLEAEVDERRVDAAQHVLDLALVDVAQVRLPVGALDVDLREAAVLDERHAQLLAVVGDEDDLALRLLGGHGRRAAAELERRRWCPRPLPSSCRTMALGRRRSRGRGLGLGLAAGARRAFAASGRAGARRPVGPRGFGGLVGRRRACLAPAAPCAAAAARRLAPASTASPRSSGHGLRGVLPAPRRAAAASAAVAPPARLRSSRRPRACGPPARRRPPRPRARASSCSMSAVGAGGGRRGCRGGDAWRAARRRRRRARRRAVVRRRGAASAAVGGGLGRAAVIRRRPAGRLRAVTPPRWRLSRRHGRLRRLGASGGCGCCGSSPPCGRPGRRRAFVLRGGRSPRRVPAGSWRRPASARRAPGGRRPRPQGSAARSAARARGVRRGAAE